MISLSDLCRDVFLLAHVDLDESGPSRGRSWEQRIADYLACRGVHCEVLPGGYRLFGHASLSGMRHQVDGAIGCADAIVIAEWKAYKGNLPKNELLRFKAATDDYFMALGNQTPMRPVIRVFGGTGKASEAVRSYACRHGIALIEPDRWPVPTLLSGNGVRQDRSTTDPRAADRRHLAWAVRPLQRVLVAQADGSFIFPRPLRTAQIEALNSLHRHWSDEFWQGVDCDPGRFELMVERVQRCLSR